MTYCIYCKTAGEEVEYDVEHVVPQSLGTYTPLTPTLSKRDRLVCKGCNSTFSKLETIFNEDTVEGLISQQLNLQGSHSVRIRGERLSISTVTGFGEAFFDEIFPFLEWRDNQFFVVPTPQVKIRGYKDGYLVFPIEKLRILAVRKNRKFRKTKEILEGVDSKDISIFTFADSESEHDMDEIITLLEEFGVDYDEKKRVFKPKEEAPAKKWEMDIEYNIDRDVLIVIAKMLFNYFSFCAIQDGKKEVLYEPAFDTIKQFICGDESVHPEDILVSINEDPILYHEKETGQRLLSHLLTFTEIDGEIIAQATLFGRNVFKIKLGLLPEEVDPENFGCGHAFNPFDRIIANLSQVPREDLSEEDLKTTFGLYKRVR